MATASTHWALRASAFGAPPKAAEWQENRASTAHGAIAERWQSGIRPRPVAPGRATAFEPLIGSTLYTLSKRAASTSHPPLLMVLLLQQLTKPQIIKLG